MLPKDLSDELISKAHEIMKEEKTYLTFLRYQKRGLHKKMQDMLEDLFDRYGQKLDGNPDSKVDIDGTN
jgi:hypothetical protein